jgi:hypothetical protein
MELPKTVIDFLERQGFVIVSTLGQSGAIHCSAKGILSIEKAGRVLLADLYLHQTYTNLQKDPRVSLTSVDEHSFCGYTLQGQARIIPRDKILAGMLDVWENRIIQRMSHRVIKGVQTAAKSKGHFEAGLPQHPQYVLEVTVENIIDLSPPAMRKNQVDL